MKKITSSILIVAVTLFATGLYLSTPHTAIAGSLTVMSDTMSREKISTLSSHTIVFRSPTEIATNGNTIAIAFPSDFDFTSIVIGEVTVKIDTTTAFGTTAETLAASPSGTAWGAVFTDGNCSASKKCTLTLTAPTDGIGTTKFSVNMYMQLVYASTHATNPASAGSKSVTITTTADSGTFAVPIAGASANDDQVVVTATVAPNITFTNDDATIGFGTLSSGAAQYANGTSGQTTDTTAHTLVVGTNATSGYTLTYSGANLTSGANTIPIANGTTTITSDADGTPGSGQFALDGTMTGSGSMASGYNHATPDWKFVPSTTTTLSSHTGPTSSDSIAMHYLANIPASQPAGAYSTTITFIATANF